MARVLAALLVSLLAAPATFAQTAPTEASIREVMNRVRGYLLTATPVRPINGDTGAAVSFSNLPQNVALARTTMPIYQYESGVTYSGVLRAWQATNDARFRTYVNDRLWAMGRIGRHMQANYPNATFDTYPTSVSGNTYSLRRVLFPQNLDDSGSMCFALARAYRAGVGGTLRPFIDNYADWVSARQFRLADRTFARNQPMPNSVWLDDLYMSVPCLAQMGTITGDRRYFDDAARQILQFHSRMFVAETGLWMHGWVQEMSPHPAFHWARANGWAIMALAELLTELPNDHPQRAQLLNIFRTHAAALRRTQAPSGLWRQLLDRTEPASYEETSSSAMFVFAIARGIRYGWLSNSTYRPVVTRGWNGVISRVNAIGQVEGTCIGTGLGWDDTFYFNRPTSVDAAHGYGPIFLAGADIIYLLRRYP